MSTNDERAKDAEALLAIASDAWNQHQANCRITTVSGSLQKVCEAISAHLAARLDSLAGENAELREDAANDARAKEWLAEGKQAAEAELARLRPDATRYRWLREHDNADMLAEDVIDEALAAQSQGVL
jgi:hypothetical protein